MEAQTSDGRSLLAQHLGLGLRQLGEPLLALLLAQDLVAALHPDPPVDEAGHGGNEEEEEDDEAFRRASWFAQKRVGRIGNFFIICE